MTYRMLLLVGLIAGALLLAACSSSSTNTTAGTERPGGADSDVSIESFAFGPDDLSISVGDTITWTNDESGVGHTTTSNDGIWDSETLKPGDTFKLAFDEAGTFTYFCSIHPSMTATITVNG